MKLTSILDITQGRLLTSPSISSFDNITVDLKKVHRGSLYIAMTEESAAEAIERGAYGVMTQKKFSFPDQETAWILVDAIDLALIRLLRYFLIKGKSRFYLTTPVSVDILEKILQDPTTVALRGTIPGVFETISYHLGQECVFYSSHESFLRSVFPSYKQIKPVEQRPFEVLSHTLFTTSLFFHGEFYRHLHFPYLYINELAAVMHWAKEKELSHDLNKLDGFDHFVPVFIDRHHHPVSFGKSNRVLIFEKDSKLCALSIAYIRLHTRWGKSWFLLPESWKNDIEDQANCLFYGKETDIFEMIPQTDFHFLFICGQESGYAEQLKTEASKPTLF